MGSRYEKNKRARKRASKKRRRKLTKVLISIFIILIISLLIWGKFIEVNLLTVNDEKIVNENIPDNFSGTKIVHFSDIHYGTGFNEKRLNNLIEKINSYKPDIIVFTGDLIDKEYNASENDINTIVKSLSKLESKLGKYAVTGNHDYYNENYENIIYDSGFTLLKNNYDTIYYKENNPMLIYGIDNITYGDPRVDILNKQSIDSITYKIVLLHEPDYIDQFVNNYDVNLILAGHSHNGQVKLPFLKPFYLPEGSKTYYDKYYNVNNTDIYVSNGVGSSIYDFRLFSIPSINVYRLDNK